MSWHTKKTKKQTPIASFSRLRRTGHSSHFFISSQVMILITGAHKAFALYKAIEEGVNHMWTVSAFQQHPQTVFVCDEDATLELRVKTVKYFQGDTKFTMFQCLNYYISRRWIMENTLILVISLGMMHVHNKLVETLPSGPMKNWGDLFQTLCFF